MQLKTLWSIIIKIIGVYFTFNVVQVLFFVFIAAVDGAISSKNGGNSAMAVLLIQGVLGWMCLFRTDFIIGLFKLEESIAQKEITTNIELKNVLRLAIAVIGIWSLSDSIPELISCFFGKFNATMTLIAIIKVLLGFLMVVRNNDIEAFIARNQRKRA